MRIHVGRDKSGLPSKARLAGAIGLASLCLLAFPLGSSGAWAQHGPPWVQARAEKKPPPSGFAAQPVPVQTAAPIATPVALPVTNASSAFTTALAACDQASTNSEPLALPGAKGEVKLDRCYRGRDSLVCGLNAILTEGRSLLDSYKRIVDAKYPDVSNVEGICSIKPDNLATDLESATDFAARFKVLRAEYDARANCATKVEQSFRDVTLPDMAQAPDILKSMVGAIEGDMKGVSGLEAQVADLAEKIDAAQRAMGTIRKIHRAMCVRNPRPVASSENQASR